MRVGRRPVLARRQAALAAGRRRRPLIFYAVAACAAGELYTIVVGMNTLVLLFSLAGLLLCTVIFRSAKT